MFQPADEIYMRLALQLVQATQGQTGMNPSVGCVVVKDGRVVGTGAHLRMGRAHAEVHALDMAGSAAEGSTAYVTLEPCSHYGRTPPCSLRLISDRVSRVVIATTDPNPKVAGRGIALLREHGIEVEVGLLREEAQLLNESYNHFILNRRPFVTLKSASTLDGRIASRTGDSRWISGESSREITHSLRHVHHAIMVGVETVLADDPLLTTRLSVPAMQPIRVIVDSNLRTPLDAQVVTDHTTETWVVCTEAAEVEKEKQLANNGVIVIRCGNGPRVNLTEMMDRLYEREIGSVLLEGGATLNGAMLAEGLVQKLVLFLAPKLIGGGAEAPVWCALPGIDQMKDSLQLVRVKVEQVGDDACITGYME